MSRLSFFFCRSHSFSSSFYLKDSFASTLDWFLSLVFEEFERANRQTFQTFTSSHFCQWEPKFKQFLFWNCAKFHHSAHVSWDHEGAIQFELLHCCLLIPYQSSTSKDDQERHFSPFLQVVVEAFHSKFFFCLTQHYLHLNSKCFCFGWGHSDFPYYQLHHCV